MINAFSGETADIVWQKAYAAIKGKDDSLSQQSRLGLTREILHAQFCIENPRQRWIFSRQPAINPAFAIAEVFWILSGCNELNFLKFWNPSLSKFVGNDSHCHGAYGHRIRKQFNVDQLELAFNVLKNNPNSRQVIIQIWDPRVDFPNDDGTPKNSDIPCNICSMPKIRNGKLEWLQIMRSNDLNRGTPYNFVQFTVLQEILSGWLGVDVGEYNQISDSLHIYEQNHDEFTCIDSGTYINTDNLAVSKHDYNFILPTIFDKLTMLTEHTLDKKSFHNICSHSNLPSSYNNLLLIAAADSARRRKWPEEVQLAISQCGNPVLLASWLAWENRWKTKV